MARPQCLIKIRGVRTPEQVVESLFRTANQPPPSGQVPPRPENKRVWASLLKGKAAVIQEVAQEMQRRDPEGIKTRVALTDGQPCRFWSRGRSASLWSWIYCRFWRNSEGCARLPRRRKPGS